MKTYSTPAEYFSDRKHEPFRVVGERLSPLELSIVEYIAQAPLIKTPTLDRGLPLPRAIECICQFYFEYFKHKRDTPKILEMVDKNLKSLDRTLLMMRTLVEEYNTLIPYKSLEALGQLKRKFAEIRDKYGAGDSDIRTLEYSDFYPDDYARLTSNNNPFTREVKKSLELLRSKGILFVVELPSGPRVRANRARIIRGIKGKKK